MGEMIDQAAGEIASRAAKAALKNVDDLFDRVALLEADQRDGHTDSIAINQWFLRVMTLEAEVISLKAALK